MIEKEPADPLEAIRNKTRNARLDWRIQSDEPCDLLDDLDTVLTALRETEERLADIHVKDSVKTCEINILTAENRQLRATLEERTRERDEAQAGFNRLDALIGEAETGLDALGAMQERLRAAEATLTAAQVLIGKWRQRADDTDDGPPRGLPYAHALRLAERKCAEELEAALGSSPARLECDVCGFPEEGYPHLSGRCSKPDCNGMLRALGSSPAAKEQK